jgi:hypothetical protein
MKDMKRQRRGSVMVESLIVIGMIAVMLAVGIFLHSAYIYKIAAMRESRSAAQQAAGHGCGGGVSGGIIGSIASAIRIFDDSPVQAGSPGFSVGASTSGKSYSVQEPALIGGQAFSMNSESRVACNEENPPFSDIVGIFQWGFSEIIPSF